VPELVVQLRHLAPTIIADSPVWHKGQFRNLPTNDELRRENGSLSIDYCGHVDALESVHPSGDNDGGVWQDFTSAAFVCAPGCRHWSWGMKNRTVKGCLWSRSHQVTLPGEAGSLDQLPPGG
jgi:hypothetical protein